MDIATDQIAYANEHYGAGEQRHFLTVGAEEDWPFAPATFDAVTVIEVVEHLIPTRSAPSSTGPRTSSSPTA